MKRYIGLDVHAASTTFAVMSEAGNRLGSHVVETHGQALVEQLKTIPGEKHVCLEEGAQSAWIYEIRSPYAAEVVVAVISESRGQKSDERDAFGLADRLRTGAVARKVFKETGEFRTLRELGRTHQMVAELFPRERRAGLVIGAVQEDDVQMRVESQVRRRALHDRHRAGLRAERAAGCRALDVERVHGLDEDAREGAQQRAVAREPASPRKRERQHPLPERVRRENSIHEVRCRRAHSPAEARGAKSSALAAERDEPALIARAASKSGEAPTEPAVDPKSILTGNLVQRRSDHANAPATHARRGDPFARVRRDLASARRLRRKAPAQPESLALRRPHDVRVCRLWTAAQRRLPLPSGAPSVRLLSAGLQCAASAGRAWFIGSMSSPFIR